MKQQLRKVLTHHAAAREQYDRRFAAWLLIILLAWLVSCSNIKAPVEAAETDLQEAFALYTTFVIFEERSASLIESGVLTESQANEVYRAYMRVKPTAEQLYALATSNDPALESTQNKFLDQLQLFILSMQVAQ